MTEETCQRPPRRVRMPRAFSSAAMTRGVTVRADVLDHRPQILGMTVSVSRYGLPERRTALSPPGAAHRPDQPAPGSQRRWDCPAVPPCPGHRQRLPGAPGDRLPLLLGHERHDAYGEIVLLPDVAAK